MIISQNFTYRNPTYIIGAIGLIVGVIALIVAVFGIVISSSLGLIFTILAIIGTIILIRIIEVVFQFFEVKKQFFTWAEAWDELTGGKPFNASANLVGRNETLENLYSMIQDQNVQ